jgi:paraquat-inducible protein B
MAKQNNTVAIGAFVSGAVILLFTLLFYVGDRSFGRDSVPGLLVFDGSVKGLTVGAPVALKGVKIGEVTDLLVVVNKDTFEVFTPVEIVVYSDRIKNVGQFEDLPSLQPLVERGLRAQLQTQSLLTGLLYVQLDFHRESEVRYLGRELSELYDDDIVELPTIPTELERFTRSLNEFDFTEASENISELLTGLEGFVNNPDMQAMPGKINKSLAAMEELSITLEREINRLAPGVNSLVDNADSTVVSLNKEIPVLSSAAQESLHELTQALSTARTALESVDYTLSDDSAVMYDVRQAAQELGKAGRALQSLAETLETQPESLLRGKNPLED